MAQADESIELDENIDGGDLYDDEEWDEEERDEDDFDELVDPDVPHRALTDEARRFEAYVANWMRRSHRRIQVARDLLRLEPDAGISALLALTVDPDLHNDDDENPYDVDAIRHRFNSEAITELLRLGGSAARAVRWLVDRDPNGANLQHLVLQDEFMMDAWMVEVVPSAGSHDSATESELQLQALRHLVGAPQLEGYLRRIAMGELVDAAGANGYADVRQLAADDDLSWILSSMPDRSGTRSIESALRQRSPSPSTSSRMLASRPSCASRWPWRWPRNTTRPVPEHLRRSTRFFPGAMSAAVSSCKASWIWKRNGRNPTRATASAVADDCSCRQRCGFRPIVRAG